MTSIYIPGILCQMGRQINGRSGNFFKRDREKMFISTQTYEGIQITTLSIIELIRFLLENGVNFILTEKFNQDCLEQNFWTHRSLGGRSDNPTLEKFGYDENTIRMQRSVVPVTGNTKGGFFSLRIFFLENYYKDWLDNKFSQSQSIQKYLQQPLK